MSVHRFHCSWRYQSSYLYVSWHVKRCTTIAAIYWPFDCSWKTPWSVDKPSWYFIWQTDSRWTWHAVPRLRSEVSTLKTKPYFKKANNVYYNFIFRIIPIYISSANSSYFYIMNISMKSLQRVMATNLIGVTRVTVTWITWVIIMTFQIGLCLFNLRVTCIYSTIYSFTCLSLYRNSYWMRDCPVEFRNRQRSQFGCLRNHISFIHLIVKPVDYWDVTVWL